jgi:hypothetical protein
MNNLRRLEIERWVEQSSLTAKQAGLPVRGFAVQACFELLEENKELQKQVDTYKYFRKLGH